MSTSRLFAKYVSQNIIGMIGVSFYIIIDTFFISAAAGANGIAALNLALPIYGLIFAIGGLIGVGSATRYAIYKAQHPGERDTTFLNAVFWIVIFGIPFMIAGLFCPDRVIALMGGDETLINVGRGYFRLFLCFAPLFMLNSALRSYISNDGDPTRSMISTIAGSLFNVVFDYIFMFKCGMGLTGAALATVTLPVIGVLISCTHFGSEKNTLKFAWSMPSIKKLINACQLGTSAFVSEISGAVITTVFNFLILARTGNIGVAAYGVIANYALVGTAFFSGITLGMQPLVSASYGRGESNEVRKYFKYGVMTAIGFALLVVLIAWIFTDPLVAIFNSEKNEQLALLARDGMRLYFLGYLFSGVNIIATGFFSAVARAKYAAIASIMRGFVITIICAIVMATLFGMTGIWLSFMAAEIITLVVVTVFVRRHFILTD